MEIIFSTAAFTIPILLVIVVAFLFRTVVPTNMVHIVQSGKRTTSYGTGQKAGNVYYRWPSWIPILGITSIKLPVSNFDQSFKDYEAYDKDRVPFMLDITAFFRIADTNKAAERVSTIDELKAQLKAIIQGAVRKILASHDINSIMTDRATFGNQFTEEVKGELANWGVEPVKNIELMDMRDSKGSTVIADIMAKKSSQITMESRIEVAKNNKDAELAEVTAKQQVDVRRQEAEENVGKRTAEKTKVVGIAEQQSKQEIAEEEAKTADKTMAVEKINKVRLAEIEKEAAQHTKERLVLEGQGEGEKRRAIMEADGALAQKLEAWRQVNEMYANAIKEYKGDWVPSIIMGGNGSASQNPAMDMINLMVAKAAKELSLDMTMATTNNEEKEKQ